MEELKIIECPRDAMQGIKEFIPTTTKISYINELLKVGFDTIDFGSFVSPKAIPQMKDTAEVLKHLNLSNTRSKLLAIVANERGAQDAAQFEEINYLGYPFSVSETFQQRNTNTSIEGSLGRLESIQEIAVKSNKKLVVYLSMGFGNPYGDPWNAETVLKWASRLNNEMGIEILSLSDTIGVSTAGSITSILNGITPNCPMQRLVFTFTQHQTLITKKSRQPMMLDADDLMVQLEGLEVVQWPKMTWLEICRLKKWWPILQKTTFAQILTMEL